MPVFIGCDPGHINYGYSVLDICLSGARLHVKIKEIGLLTAQINNLTDKPTLPPKSKRRKRNPVVYAPFNDQLIEFHNLWHDVFTTYKPVKITAERFMARMRLLGVAIEIVSMMNGTLCTLADAYDAEVQIITAAAWKNNVNRLFSLDEFYKKCRLPPHAVDACFIGIQGALKHHKLEWVDVNLAPLLKDLTSYELPKDS